MQSYRAIIGEWRYVLKTYIQPQKIFWDLKCHISEHLLSCCYSFCLIVVTNQFFKLLMILCNDNITLSKKDIAVSHLSVYTSLVTTVSFLVYSLQCQICPTCSVCLVWVRLMQIPVECCLHWLKCIFPIILSPQKHSALQSSGFLIK